MNILCYLLKRLNKKYLSGFALVEILLTISIISLVAASGFGVYSDYTARQTVNNSADKVMEILTDAKSRALSQVKPSSGACSTSSANDALYGYQVVLCPGGCSSSHNYQMRVVCGSGGSTFQQVGPTYSLPAGVTFSPSTQQLVTFKAVTGATEGIQTFDVSGNGKLRQININQSGVISGSQLALVTPTPTPAGGEEATPTPFPPPSAPVVSGLPSCSNTSYSATFTWGGYPNTVFGYNVDVSQTSSFSTLWSKNVPSANSTVGPTGFSGGSTLTFTPSITYYVRVSNGTNSPTAQWSVPLCPTPTPTNVPPTPTNTPVPNTPTPTLPPAPATPSVSNPSCSTGAYTVTLNWSGTPNQSFGFRADISTSSSFSSFWSKTVSSGTSTSAPSGFTGSPTLVLNPGTTYYARIYNGNTSGIRSWNTPVCPTPTPSGPITQFAYLNPPTGLTQSGTNDIKRTWMQANTNISITQLGCYQCGSGKTTIWRSNSSQLFVELLAQETTRSSVGGGWYARSTDFPVDIPSGTYFIVTYEGGTPGYYGSSANNFTEVNFLKKSTFNSPSWTNGAWEIRLTFTRY